MNEHSHIKHFIALEKNEVDLHVLIWKEHLYICTIKKKGQVLNGIYSMTSV